MRAAYIAAIFLLSLGSCKNRATEKEEVVMLASNMSIDEFSDSTFFSQINCLVEYEGDIYISLDKRMQIVRLDKDLNLLSTMGSAGRGPGEFTFINTFFVFDDIVWAGSDGVLALMKYTTDGAFMGIEEKTGSRFTKDNRFAIEDGIMYFSKVDEDKKTSLATLNLYKNGDGFYKEFGTFTDFGSSIKNRNQNRRHVFVSGDYIIAIPEGIPVIEKYDKENLELIESFDLTFHPVIKEGSRLVERLISQLI